MEITEEIASKVLSVVDKGLSDGLGEPIPGEMCVEAAVCYAMGLPHGDDPPCVSPLLRYLKMQLNDANWMTNESRAKGLRRLAIAQLGTKDTLDEKVFFERVYLLAINLMSECNDNMFLHEMEKYRMQSRFSLNVLTSYSEKRVAFGGICLIFKLLASWYGGSRSLKVIGAYSHQSERYDEYMAKICENIVQILISMNAVGTKWLYLTEKSRWERSMLLH